MFRRFVGASLLAVWFVLSGIVLAESVGFIENPPDTNGSVEVWLVSFGTAIRTSKQTQITLSPAVFVKPEIFCVLLLQNPSFKVFGKKRDFSKEEIPIYKLHRVFLV
jgi:hypothetical protein